MPPRNARSALTPTLRWVLLAAALLLAVWWWQQPASAPSAPGAGGSVASGGARTDWSVRGDESSTALPAEAVQTLRRIRTGGPFPHRQDDGVFGNRERLLPVRPRGWYREYTVPTPGERDRGARRIVTGGRPPVEFFYTDDHYRSFRRIDLEAARAR